MLCYFNNQFIPLTTAALSVTDLGLQRGYGIFDFIRVANQVPLYIDDHLDRFYHSAEYMRLPVKQSKNELKAIIYELIQKNALSDSGIRILLTGGASPDGYEIIQPNLTIIEQPLSPPPDVVPSGYKLVTYAHQRQLPQVKTTNYLVAVWLQPWVKEQGADDVLYQQNGIVSECPRSNFFIVTKDGLIVTPAKNILNGIIRKQILKLGPLHGMRIEERDVSIEDIRLAKEAFISSSTKRVIPVRQVDDMHFVVSPASLTSKIFELLRDNEPH